MITFRGSISAPLIEAMLNINSSVNVFAVVNTFRSRVKVDVLRLVLQMDNIQAPTVTVANRVMPLFRTKRVLASSVTGGIEIKYRSAWDSEIASHDEGVKILYDPGRYGSDETKINVSENADAIWQQYTMRQASAVEQNISWDNFQIAALSASNSFLLLPGEAIVVEQIASIPTGGTCFFNLAWQEKIVDVGYILAGNVKAGETNIEGAKVFVLTDVTKDMVNPELEILGTNVSGDFNKSLASGVKAAVFVQHKEGNNLFTDEGKPFIEKP